MASRWPRGAKMWHLHIRCEPGTVDCHRAHSETRNPCVQKLMRHPNNSCYDLLTEPFVFTTQFYLRVLLLTWLRLNAGWMNPMMHKHFAEYAKLAFETFGDRVKYWITFEDPLTFCSRSFADKNFPPGVNVTGIASYICSYVILMSHADVYHLYDNGFRSTQKGIPLDLVLLQ